MKRRHAAARLLGLPLLMLLVSGLLLPAGSAPAARAQAPAVVALGDSAISGEAGRWAGNTNDSPSRTDALGPTAYYDNATNTAETIPGCHRSKSAEVLIGGGVTGV
ncbi:MAG TPA: hypothetical protein VFM49_10735, partial [Chloroflexia bacterium]|nr:hypothetical protein [Chloroflexia bacterium]